MTSNITTTQRRRVVDINGWHT